MWHHSSIDLLRLTVSTLTLDHSMVRNFKLNSDTRACVDSIWMTMYYLIRIWLYNQSHFGKFAFMEIVREKLRKMHCQIYYYRPLLWVRLNENSILIACLFRQQFSILPNNSTYILLYASIQLEKKTKKAEQKFFFLQKEDGNKCLKTSTHQLTINANAQTILIVWFGLVWFG